ncbi:MAG: hypothetical protein HY308_13490 [Gammaproteobacteria bacterium]|nr:hypothetical protein [Gammaproteobacteria bacterium]
MIPQWQITFQAPEDEVDGILEKLTAVVPLEYGNNDKCALRSASGVEYYRPLAGSHVGAEDDVRKRPGVVVVSFLIPPNDAMLRQTIDAIAAAHSYEEPVITVQTALASRSKTIGAKDNPNRWWNRGGDWKTGS